MPTIAEAMSLGVQLQDAGRLADAEALYRQVLDADPHEANAKYRLAVVCQMQGRNAEAIDHYRQLLQIKPESPKVHNNLGLAYAAQGQPADALASYQAAIRLKPDFAEAFNNLGNLHSSGGASDQAVIAYRHAVALKPHYSAAWINLGRACLDQRQLAEAVHSFQEALTQQPQNVAVWNNLGNAWLEQGKLQDADASYRRALQIRSEDAEAHYNLARVFAAQQRWHNAVLCLKTSLACNDNSVKALGLLGDICYCQLGDGEEALRCYRRVLILAPGDAKAHLLTAALTGSSRLAQVPAGFISATYDPLAERFDQYVGRRGDCSPQWLRSVLGQPPTEPSLSVLDLGCGTGLCGVQFRAWAKSLIGVDLSANMLAKAHARGIYDELIQSDILIPLQKNEQRFDLILASDVLLYIGDLAPLVDAARRALRPGGRFAFTIDLLLEGDADYRLTPWIHFAHARAYLDRLVRATQMQTVRTQEVAFPRDGGFTAAGLVMVLRC